MLDDIGDIDDTVFNIKYCMTTVVERPLACGTCPFALLWLPVIADFRVTIFPYISL